MRDLLGEPGPDARHTGDLLDGGTPEPGDAAKVLQQELFAMSGDARAVVENTLGDTAFHEELVIAIGETMRLIANALEEHERATVVGEDQGLRPAGAIDFFEFLGEANDRDFMQAEPLKLAAG